MPAALTCNGPYNSAPTGRQAVQLQALAGGAQAVPCLLAPLRPRGVGNKLGPGRQLQLPASGEGAGGIVTCCPCGLLAVPRGGRIAPLAALVFAAHVAGWLCRGNNTPHDPLAALSNIIHSAVPLRCSCACVQETAPATVP